MTVHELKLPGLLLFTPDVYGDDRGFFLETWNAARYREHGLDAGFVQDNVSYSTHGVLRGLHYQDPHPQGTLVMVLRGEIFDVAVDIREDAATFGTWEGGVVRSAKAELSSAELGGPDRPRNPRFLHRTHAPGAWPGAEIFRCMPIACGRHPPCRFRATNGAFRPVNVAFGQRRAARQDAGHWRVFAVRAKGCQNVANRCGRAAAARAPARREEGQRCG